MADKAKSGGKRKKSPTAGQDSGPEKAQRLGLFTLNPHPLSRHRRKRLGRGESSGLGKTCGRGNKGQTSRSGSGGRADFEGGQMPINRRVPKFGFVSLTRPRETAAINLKDLERYSDVSVIDLNFLKKNSAVPGTVKTLRILGQGTFTRAVTIKAHHFSQSAKAKIESAKGKAEVAE